MTLLKKIMLYIVSGSVLLLITASGFFLKVSEAEKNNSMLPPTLKMVPIAKPSSLIHFTTEHPASLYPVLRWSKVPGAVSYEIELYQTNPEVAVQGGKKPSPFYSTNQIYVSGFNADLSAYSGNNFYWRVRGLDIDGDALSFFSQPEKVYINKRQKESLKPVVTSVFNVTRGSTLLYPVYAWIPVAGAVQYEVEILDAPPENPNGILPSVHRIDSGRSTGFDFYDEIPRMADTPFFWRVRGLDQEGNPVGVYSDAGSYIVRPKDRIAVAAFGDSITHGGGAVSYSPADFEYSYLRYLDFPAVNLGKSGDTSQTMLERFDHDVLPFKPRYLIILGGTNSLRGGISAQEVIEELTAIRDKCLENDIRPIFLTLPPINPRHIKQVFDEDTVTDWQQQFQKVNTFIRTQDHIDVAQQFRSVDGVLRGDLAVDGLHLDIAGKKMIAAAINANWRQITKR